MSTAPHAGGYFRGYYEAMAAVGSPFCQFFVTTTKTSDPSHVYETAVSAP